MSILTRRDFVRLGGISMVGTPLLLQSIFANNVQSKKTGRVLILIEFKGGNDGLNMVIPFSDKKYYKLRPTIAHPEDKVVKLDKKTALSPACRPLYEVWNKGNMAIIHGVGYPQPNRSHFRSIDIWETASGSGQFLTNGWCSRMLANFKSNYALPVDAIIMSNDDSGPIRGGKINSLIMDTPESFIKQATKVASVTTTSKNQALNHIVMVQNNIVKAAQKMKLGLKNSKKSSIKLPNSRIGKQLNSVADMMSAGLSVPLFKVSMSGFDTHNNQLNNHKRLMAEFSNSIAEFRKVMINLKLWDKVMIMTYSEFGRRVQENGSNGTDHGTAAPHFIFGGKVKGGFYGKQPALNKLDKNGDLIYSVDYRSIYTTIAEKWWGLNNHFLKDKFKPLDFI